MDGKLNLSKILSTLDSSALGPDSLNREKLYLRIIGNLLSIEETCPEGITSQDWDMVRSILRVVVPERDLALVGMELSRVDLDVLGALKSQGEASKDRRERILGRVKDQMAKEGKEPEFCEMFTRALRIAKEI